LRILPDSQSVVIWSGLIYSTIDFAA